MNRRNFVVGLGTVATISGVASVTSAAFQDEVNPTTNFQIVPENANLTVQRLSRDVDYNNLTNNGSWNDSEITDFGNVTADQSHPVVAHINSSTNGALGAQLAFNSSNDTVYTSYEASGGTTNAIGDEEWGFFEVANLGDTTENVGIEYNSSSNVGDSGIISEQELQEMFVFETENGRHISPDGSNTNTTPLEFSQNIDPGQVLVIGLRITINPDVYDKIQEAAGGAFSETDDSIKLLDSIVLGTQV